MTVRFGSGAVIRLGPLAVGAISANGTGYFSFNFATPSSQSLSGRYITLTAIDSKRNTSEFSACKAYLCDVIFRHAFDTLAGEKCP